MEILAAVFCVFVKTLPNGQILAYSYTRILWHFLVSNVDKTQNWAKTNFSIEKLKTFSSIFLNFNNLNQYKSCTILQLIVLAIKLHYRHMYNFPIFLLTKVQTNFQLIGGAWTEAWAMLLISFPTLILPSFPW